MYNASFWAQLTDALKDARSGDGNALMKLADSYARRTPGGQYQSNIMESIYAVNCLDKPDTADPAQTEAFAQKLEPGGADLGSLPRLEQRALRRVDGPRDRQERTHRRPGLTADRHRRDDP